MHMFKTFLAYASENRAFVEDLKRLIERRTGQVVWVDWENVRVFEGPVNGKAGHYERVALELQSSDLVIFIVSLPWMGKEFPMLELEWALDMQDSETKVLPVLLDCKAERARKAAKNYPDHESSICSLLARTVRNYDGKLRADELAQDVANQVYLRAALALTETPTAWVTRDLSEVLLALGLTPEGRHQHERDAGRVVLLTGTSGVGKSWLTRRLVDLVRPYYLDRVARMELRHKMDMKEASKELLRQMGILPRNTGSVQWQVRAAFSTRGYLLVLDNVWPGTLEEDSQLEDLLGETWKDALTTGVGAGSVILLTSQADKTELDLPQCTKQLTMGSVDEDTAWKIFCKAFDEGSPRPHQDQCKDILAQCDGLPLALSVMGSCVSHTPQGEWDKVLKDIPKAIAATPNAPAQRKGLRQLGVAYQALPEEQQRTFVDVANFYNGSDWDANAACFSDRLEGLRSRKMVVRDSYGRIRMHDLLAHLGALENQKTRAYMTDEAPDVVARCQPRGLTLSRHSDDLSYSEGLENLNSLMIFSDTVKVDLQQCRRLQILICNLGRLREICNATRQLKVLDLMSFGSQVLSEEISKLASLHSLSVACRGMEALPEGMSRLQQLRSLTLSSTNSLTHLPEGISRLRELLTLEMYSCKELVRLPEGITELQQLQTLILGPCYSLVGLPDKMDRLKQLQKLELRSALALHRLPESISELSSLRSLRVIYSYLEQLPQGISRLQQLQTIDLYGCGGLAEVPEGITRLQQLRSLDLSYCSKLKTLPEGLTRLQQLQYLDVTDCHSLEKLPEGLHRLPRLTIVSGRRSTELPGASSDARKGALAALPIAQTKLDVLQAPEMGLAAKYGAFSKPKQARGRKAGVSFAVGLKAVHLAANGGQRMVARAPSMPGCYAYAIPQHL